MGLFAFIAAGLVIGLLARGLMPGAQRMNLRATALIGLASSFTGALIGGLFYGRRLFEVHSAGVVGGIFITFIVLILLGVRARGRRGAAF